MAGTIASTPQYATAWAVAAQVASGELWELWLVQLVDDLRRTRSAELIARAPDANLPPHLQALLASTVEAVCAEISLPVPSWCSDAHALRDPWFVSGIENLKAMALLESPVHFRKRNVFVLGNFLERV